MDAPADRMERLDALAAELIAQGLEGASLDSVGRACRLFVSLQEAPDLVLADPETPKPLN